MCKLKFRIEWRIRKCLFRTVRSIRGKFSYLKIIPGTFCYNHFTTWYTIFECTMEPMFYFVDHFAKYLGPIFMLGVMALIATVILIFYVYILPYYFFFGWHHLLLRLIIGHWLFINLGFHYFMAVVTEPGCPPLRVYETVSICKKCVSPKPPRTHHCSICRRCIIKMDHHCPWINNCVGHYNHRYFFLFCCYVSVGTLYVCITCYDLFHEHFYHGIELYFPGALYPLNYAADLLLRSKNATMSKPLDELQTELLHLQTGLYGRYLRSCVLFEFMVCGGVFVAVTSLLVWHARLISRGETSIEAHINKKQREKLGRRGKTFANPYDFGVRGNWCIFLGLQDGRTFLRHVLLPSVHQPESDGIRWTRSTDSLNVSLRYAR